MQWSSIYFKPDYIDKCEVIRTILWQFGGQVDDLMQLGCLK